VDPIYRYLFIRLGVSKEAEDLTEEVFLRSIQAREAGERGSPFSASLYRLAKNRLMDRRRRQDPQRGLPPPELDANHSIDGRDVRDEETRNLRRAMDGIQPDYREVIILRIIMALPTSVVADWMDMTEGAAGVLLLRALASLRVRMQESI
jgi:RNA polymerase sigma factor (sigma-70 family)